MAEIVQLTDITSDSQKKYVVGWMGLRGEKIPVLDLERFFRIGTPPGDRGIRSMILLKRNGGEAAQPKVVGVIVDRIEVVRQESELTFFPFPRVAQSDSTGIYRGVLLRAKELIFFLDVGALIDTAWVAN